MSINHVEIVRLDGLHFVGIPVTSVFQNHDVQRIEEAKATFFRRRHEIKHVVNQDCYFCPHFASETVFTYFFCMQVSELSDIPDGMLGFSVPDHEYGKTRSNTDPYEIIHSYLTNKGLESNPKGLAIEVYRFHEPGWPDHVDVYVPIK